MSLEGIIALKEKSCLLDRLGKKRIKSKENQMCFEEKGRYVQKKVGKLKYRGFVLRRNWEKG